MFERTGGRRAPTKRRGARPIPAVLCLAALLLAACGEGDADGPEAEAEEQPEEASSDAADPQDEADSAEEGAAPFYEGQTIEILVPLGPGGGTDIAARILAKYLEIHLEGNPTVQVLNEEGGGDVRVGTNMYADVEPDGMTLFMAGSSNHQAELYGQEGFDLSLGELTPLVGTTAGAVMLARTDTGVESFGDALESDIEWFHGDRGPRSGFLSRATALELLGLETTDLLGFESASAIHLAFEQGELNLNGYSTSQYLNEGRPMVEAGDAVELFTLGRLRDGEVVRDDAYPEHIPTVLELYEELHGTEPSGPQWEAYKMQLGSVWMVDKAMYVHGDAPQQAVDELRAALEAIAEDPDFNAEAEEELGGYPLLHWTELEHTVERFISGADPGVVQWLVDWVMENYETDLRE